MEAIDERTGEVTYRTATLAEQLLAKPMPELFAALAKAQAAMKPAKKSGFNPHFKSTYSTLADVREAVVPHLAEHGISVLQGARVEDGHAVITTVLGHDSGQSVSEVLVLPVSAETPQAYGSAFTYGRRFGLCALTGCVADDDDDGNAASHVDINAQRNSVTERAKEVLANTRPRHPVVEHQTTSDGEVLVPFGTFKGKPLSSLDEGQLRSHSEFAAKRAANGPPHTLDYLKLVESEIQRRVEGASLYD